MAPGGGGSNQAPNEFKLKKHKLKSLKIVKYLKPIVFHSIHRASNDNAINNSGIFSRLLEGVDNPDGAEPLLY